MTCGKIDLRCRRCRLSEKRTQVVPGSGPRRSNIAFIGEAPGKDEDLKGVPFVGRAGRLLDRALEQAGVSRDKVFICNLVKCRPPNNRRPRKDEIAACSKFLCSELQAVKPEVLVALGQTVVESFLTGKRRMMDIVGSELAITICGRRVRLFVTYHPAACLYQRKNLRAFNESIRASLKAAHMI
ncbi:MAG: uracil-DNA glycosylase [Thermoplasmata archaeon]